MDTLVACTITLPYEEQVEIKDFIEKSSENDFDILLLDQETLDTYVDGLQGYKFLSNLN
jgi:hypothetical protein